MDSNTVLKRIRSELFYGIREYTKSLPDFLIAENLSICSRKVAKTFLDDLRESLRDESELLVYIHLPFCTSECIYCNTFPQRTDEALQRAYLPDLLTEIDRFVEAGLFQGKTIRSIFFGGGTPTTYANEDLKTILDRLLRAAPLTEGGTITTEATPASVDDPARIRGLQKIGITRLSIGCQTFDPKLAKRCGRPHTVEQVHRIIGAAKGCGLTTNIDIMLGLPGQTLDAVARDLEVLEQIGPDAVEFIRHEIVNPRMIALYQKRPELLIADDDLFEMILLAHRWSDEHGYEQNGRFTNDFAFPYRFYWVREWPLLAFGARIRATTKTTCWENPDDLSLYSKLLQRAPHAVTRYQFLSVRDQMYRSLFLNLQVKSGLHRARFQERFGEDPAGSFPNILPQLQELGVVEIDDQAIRLTPIGSFFFEDVCCFIIDAAIAAEYPELIRAPFAFGKAQLEERRTDSPKTPSE
jgi:oxygen-independent coproporphyrinogen-3 oxidase